MKKVFLLVLLLCVPTVVAAGQHIYLPAVQETEVGLRGVLVTLEMDVKPGTGHVYIDTSPLTQIDTQGSARLAKEVAENILNIRMDNYDMFLTIKGDSPVVGGPSAGASITAFTITEILNLSIDNRVVVTGTINPDGSIGKVGGIFEKAQAVSKINNSIFLIPEGNAVITRQETKKKESAGIKQIISKPVRINIIEYAQRNWNLRVKEVSNVKEIIEEMTGYEFKERKAVEFKENPILKERLKEIAFREKRKAETKLKQLKQRKQGSTALPYNVIQEIESSITKQETVLQDVQDFIDQEKYYAAASKLFIFSIYNKYGNNLIDFFEQDHSEKYIKDLLNGIEEHIENIEKRVENTTTGSKTKVEVIITAKERLSDSKSRLENAWKNYYNGNFVSALYEAAYTKERANTVLMWLDISKPFENQGQEFDFGILKNMATKKMEEASSAIIYAQTIGLPVENAKQSLKQAQKDLNNKEYGSSIFNSIVSNSEAEVAMELRGVQNIGNEVKNYKERALDSIATAQNSGAVPVMALSYYEYALTFDKPENKIRYLKYAKGFGEFSNDLLTIGEERKKIIDKEKYVKPKQPPMISYDYTLFIVGLILSLLVGFVIGFYVKKRKII